MGILKFRIIEFIIKRLCQFSGRGADVICNCLVCRTADDKEQEERRKKSFHSTIRASCCWVVLSPSGMQVNSICPLLHGSSKPKFRTAAVHATTALDPIKISTPNCQAPDREDSSVLRCRAKGYPGTERPQYPQQIVRRYG